MTERVALSKIVYFDEGSATDFIQIVNGGEALTIRECQNQTDRGAGVSVNAKANLKTKLLEILTGIDVSAETAGYAGVSFNTSIVAKSIISNTVLTDFLGAVADNSDVITFNDYVIRPINNSLSSYALMTPYLAMLRGGNVQAGDFNLALDKLDSTINSAKGYFEFLGERDGEKTVFRFNNSSFKNNYKANDLMRMNLVIYAVLVGSCMLRDLEVDNELNVPGGVVVDNPDFEYMDAPTISREDAELPIYDVLLAGVKSNG